ncbi:hypothetical protein KUV51_02055 [Tateyamaria omphalii]|uniref:hypothetical protein n=1 Tax=Tateyamaria omphalii TaxID=299262 RepID=UPI001C99A90E|nr:hypothetical protein [Tateyamaria omphalii]MBY5931769.1 hypothetical protein [Tateyamaria omphalii]
MSRIAHIACLLALPGTAMACPTSADLDTGVRFELASGEWETFRRISDAVIEATFYYEPGEATQVSLSQGIYILSIIEVESNALVPSTRETFTYPLRPGEMPDPAGGGGWNVEATLLSSGGLDREVQSYTFGTSRRQGYGACFYEMIPITYRYRLEGEEETGTDELHYLPELGISYLAASRGNDYDDRYDYVSIKALKP